MRVYLPSTAHKAAQHTSPKINRAIRERIREQLGWARTHGHFDMAIRRTQREWDTERVLETNASMLILVGILLGAKVDKRWLFLSGTVAGFLLQHALQGYCPPLPVIRWWGVKTADELFCERMALKLMRGDFRQVDTHDPEAVLRAVMKG